MSSTDSTTTPTGRLAPGDADLASHGPTVAPARLTATDKTSHGTGVGLSVTTAILKGEEIVEETGRTIDCGAILSEGTGIHMKSKRNAPSRVRLKLEVHSAKNVAH